MQQFKGWSIVILPTEEIILDIRRPDDLEDIGTAPAWQLSVFAALDFLRRAAARNTERFAGVMR